MANVVISGGGQWLAHLAAIAEQNLTLRVGILEHATAAEDGTPRASIAALHEFGGVVTRPPRQQTLRFRINAQGRQVFAKKRHRRISKTVEATIPGGEAVIPSRPFMRNTVAAQKQTWAAGMARNMTGHPQGVAAAMNVVGELMAKDIQQTIQNSVPPPLKPATIASKRRRGKREPEKTLIDTGAMQEAINFEVTSGDI